MRAAGRTEDNDSRWRVGRLGLAVCAVAALAIPQQADAQGGKAPVRGGTAVVAIGGDPPTVNPNVSTGIPDQLVGCILYEGLVDVSADLKVVPALAKSWSVSDDGRVYEFELNRAKWHDGKPFTSEDVKFSLLEVSAKYGAIFAPAGRAIDSIDTPAPDKVRITLKRPFAPFLISLTCADNGAIMPAHIYRDTDVLRNPATTSKPVGTGAFKLAEWKRGDYLRLVRNPDYWQPGKPYLDEVIAKIIPQSSSRLQALQAGEVDLIPAYYFAVNDHPVVKADKRLKLETSGFPPSTDLIFFNVDRKPLNDPRVRQALFMGTDREYLLKTAWFGTGEVGVMPFNSLIEWAANPEIDYRKLYPFDPTKANQLLDAAGLPRGANDTRFGVKVVYPSDAAERAQVAQALKGMWRQIGVDVTIDPVERTAQVKRVFQDRDFDLTIQSYTTYGDPALGIARTFVSSSVGKPFGNPSGYSNPEVDALFEKAESATDLEARGDLYRAAQAILARDLPVMTVRQQRSQDAATAKLEGAWGILGPAVWSNAWLAK